MARVVQDQTLHMEVIVNNKTLDNGLNIIQLEQAVGAAVKCFNGAHGGNLSVFTFIDLFTFIYLYFTFTFIYLYIYHGRCHTWRLYLLRVLFEKGPALIL